MKTIITNKKNLFAILGIGFVILLWVIFSNIIDNRIILPKIKDVLLQLWDLLTNSRTYVIIVTTLSRLLITIIISLLLSIIMAVFSLISINYRNFLTGIVAIMRSIPVASIIVILLIIFGNSKSPLIITFFVTFPIQYEAIYINFKTIDKEIVDDIKTISNINLKVIKEVFIPIKSVNILSSIVSSIGLGFKVMVMSEVISQPNNTIGKEILYNKEMLLMNNVFAWTLIILVLVILIEVLLKQLKVHCD